MFPIRFFYNKAWNWRIGFLQIVNISKLYHMLGSNHSTFHIWSFQVSFPYKFLVLKMRILLFTKYMWKTITFHCLPSSRCRSSSTQCSPSSIYKCIVLKQMPPCTIAGSFLLVPRILKNLLSPVFCEFEHCPRALHFLYLFVHSKILNAFPCLALFRGIYSLSSCALYTMYTCFHLMQVLTHSTK
jgi:hypothetical protein